MHILVATGYGLLSALFYGTYDALAAHASRRGGVLRTMAYGQPVALLALSIALGLLGVPNAPLQIWWLLAATNIVNLAGTVLLFRAMKFGPLAIVAPLAAGYGAIGVVLSAAAGERMALLRWVGLGLVCLGAILAARPAADRNRAAGRMNAAAAIHALGAALLYGVGFWVQGRLVVPVLGVIVPAWSYYAMGALLIPAIARARAVPLDPPPGRDFFAMMATGLLGTGGYLALSAGQATGAVAVVTALSALASGFTVLFAHILLGERASVGSTAGIGLILSGVILIQL